VLLLDNSAWTRLTRRGLDEPRRQEIGRWLRERELATCLPFLLEAGYSARSAAHHEKILGDLGLFPRVAITSEIEQLALDAQADLAAVGHHRMQPADVLIAACAHESGAGILHYDKDYDLLRKHTRLRFRSEWLAPAGTLD
jgi:predicted nucleic acid-binding protein